MCIACTSKANRIKSKACSEPLSSVGPHLKRALKNLYIPFNGPPQIIGTSLFQKPYNETIFKQKKYLEEETN